MRLKDAAGLEEQAVRALSKQLHAAAAEYAAAGEVCAFQLITGAQEFLQLHNVPDEGAPESLWHAAQRREMAHDPSSGKPVDGAHGGAWISEPELIRPLPPGCPARAAPASLCR